jgi:hypothetical protein
MDFFTKLGPQFRLLPVPNFGVNRRDLAATSSASDRNTGIQRPTSSSSRYYRGPAPCSASRVGAPKGSAVRSGGQLRCAGPLPSTVG